MTERPDGDAAPDYSDLLRSPYDPDEPSVAREGESDLPWVPAVIAACLGALAVGAFVVFAVVTGPDEPEAEAAPPSTTATTIVDAEPADGPPDGFVPVTDTVAARVIGTDVSARATVVSIATAVSGGVDPGTVEPLEVAYWVLRTGDADVEMTAQSGSKLGIGNTTIEFPPQLSLRQPELIPHIAIGATTETTTIDLDATLPGDLEPLTISVGDTVVTIEELSFGAAWGWIAWSSTGPAMVDPTITFVGTDDPGAEGENPTQLVPLARRPLAFGDPARPLPTPYGFAGTESLVRSGEPVAGGNVPTAIVVELVVTVPDDVAPAAPLEVPTSP